MTEPQARRLVRHIREVRVRTNPEVANTINQILDGRKVTKIRPTEVSAALRKAGFEAAIRTPLRQARDGFKIREFSKFALAVQWEPWKSKASNYRQMSEKMEEVLKDAGFIVGRPFPDDHILFVAKEKK